MSFIDSVKNKIKQTGIESKNYIDDPEHPYHKATGFLKVQIIFGYIGFVLYFVFSIILVYYLIKMNFVSGLAIIYRILGATGTLLTLLIIVYAILYIVSLFIYIKLFIKLINKDTTYLLFYHQLCVVAYILLLISLLIDFRESFVRLIVFTIILALYTYYYCTSVRVRVYFGGDEFLKKDYFIHFLLEDTGNYAVKVTNNIAKNNVDENIKQDSTFVSQNEINEINETKLDDTTMNSNIANNVVCNAAENLSSVSGSNDDSVDKRELIRAFEQIQCVKHSKGYEYEHSHQHIRKKRKKNFLVRFLRFILSTLFKLVILIILVITLINFNSKYKLSNRHPFNIIFNVIDTITSNALEFTNEKLGFFSDFSNSEQNNDYYEEDNGTQEEVKKNNTAIDEIKSKEKMNENISSDSIKLSTNIKKINLERAKLQFNENQNAWNLLLNSKIVKDAICIVDYINPITGDPCSSTYGFDLDGKMIIGWGIDVNGEHYYFDDSTYDIGKMCTGWKKIDDKYYFFLPNGKLLTDGYTSDGYYVDKKGVLVIGKSN